MLAQLLDAPIRKWPTSSAVVGQNESSFCGHHWEKTHLLDLLDNLISSLIKWKTSTFIGLAHSINKKDCPAPAHKAYILAQPLCKSRKKMLKPTMNRV